MPTKNRDQEDIAIQKSGKTGRARRLATANSTKRRKNNKKKLRGGGKEDRGGRGKAPTSHNVS